VTDGISIWVVNDSITDKVFKYGLTGSLQGSWSINSGGGRPTGITLDPDPSQSSNSLWIVDSATDRVYEYTNSRGRTSGSQTASATFALAAGNTNPQGIADPPQPSLRSPPVAMAPISSPFVVLDSVYQAANESRAAAPKATDSRGDDAWQIPFSESSEMRRSTDAPSASVDTNVTGSTSKSEKQTDKNELLELQTAIDDFFAAFAATL
jgi:hypothetical protein